MFCLCYFLTFLKQLNNVSVVQIRSTQVVPAPMQTDEVVSNQKKLEQV